MVCVCVCGVCVCIQLIINTVTVLHRLLSNEIYQQYYVYPPPIANKYSLQSTRNLETQRLARTRSNNVCSYSEVVLRFLEGEADARLLPLPERLRLENEHLEVGEIGNS